MPIPAAVALASAIAPSVIGAIGSMFGAKQQSKSVQQANEMQLQIARENNSAQERMLMMNNAFNRQQAIDMFNMENAYNSPENQVKLLKQAGLNPATMYQNGGQVARSDASTPQAASSGITPTMPNIQPVPSMIGAMFGNFEALSRVASNLANAGLSKAQTNRISTLLGAEFDKLVQDTQSVEIQNEWNNFKLSLDKANLSRKQEQEIQELISKVWKNYAEGGAAHALVALHEIETRLTDSKFRMNEEQRPVLLENLRKMGRVYDAQVETERTKQNLNKANAGKSEAEAKSIRILNEVLPEKYANEITIGQSESIDKILNAGSAHNKYELINQLVNAGLRRDAAEAIANHRDEIVRKLKEVR